MANDKDNDNYKDNECNANMNIKVLSYPLRTLHTSEWQGEVGNWRTQMENWETT